MPKFPPIPRLSIIVPVGRDLAAFESTLISVLENQPCDSEVLVCHDGQYEDPFKLCDEVRFVVAETASLVSLVAAGASQARGRFVHILGDGAQATSGWIDPALEKFEHFDCGSVAPVIRNASTGDILSAGWRDGADRLCKNASLGRSTVGPSQRGQIGAHLQASFWRRELLRSLGDAFSSRQSVESTYAYELLSRGAGWRCVLAEDSVVNVSGNSLAWDHTSLGRGMRIQAIRNEFTRGGWWRSWKAAGLATLASLVRPSQIAEAIGRGLAPVAANQVSHQLHRDQVALCDEREIIVSMSRRNSLIEQHRKAA